MKICITSPSGRSCEPGVETLFKSIRNHTDCSGVDFKIITSDPEVLQRHGPEGCHFVTDEIKSRYHHVPYSALMPAGTYEHSWYRFESFGLEGYDRVICLDSDCLCPSDLAPLFSEELSEFDLLSVEDHIVSKNFALHLDVLAAAGYHIEKLKERLDKGQVDIQPALIVANKSIVNREFYDRLLAYANQAQFSYSLDEGVLNDFLYDQTLKIKLLPLEFDYQDCYEIHCPQLPSPEKPVVVHCQESKPFRRKREEVDPRLHKWYDLWWYEHDLGRTSPQTSGG